MAQILYNLQYEKSGLEPSPEDLIDSAAKSGLINELYIIVPTGKLQKYYHHYAIRRYYQFHKKPSPKFNIHTLRSFIKLCFTKLAEDPDSLTIISEPYRFALFEEAAEKSELNFYKFSNRHISTSLVRRLANIVFGLKEDGIRPVDMFAELSSHGRESIINDEAKFSDIARLFEKYEELLSAGLLDNDDILARVTRIIKDSLLPLNPVVPSEQSPGANSLNNIFSKSATILLYGFSEFKQPELEFLGCFSSVDFKVILHIDFSENNGPLFGNLQSTCDSLERMGFKRYNFDRFDTSNFHTEADFSSIPMASYLRRWLFNTEKEIKNERLSNFFRIYSVENRNQEAESISRLIKYLHLHESVALNDICLTMRDPSNYTHLIRDIFQKNGIPCNISDRYELASSPVISAIFSIIDIIIYGWRRTDIHKAMLGPFLTINTDEAPDPSNFFMVASKLRITGGRRFGQHMWETKLINALTSMRNLQQSLDSSAIEDQFELSQIENFARSIDKALKDISSLKACLDDTSRRMFPEEFADLIKQGIILKFNIRQNILNNFRDYDLSTGRISEFILKDDEVEKEAKALGEFLRILDEMVFILNERKKGTKFKFEDLAQRLKTSVAFAKYQIYEKSGYGVNVTTIEQTRGIDYKVMILCGAVLGEFPKYYRPETFLGKELKDTELRHIQSERMNFYQFLVNGPGLYENGSKRCFIFHPKSDNGEELVRSPFIDDLLKISTLESDKLFIDLTQLIPEDLSQGSLENAMINSVVSDSDKLIYLSGNRDMTAHAEPVADFEDLFSQKLLHVLSFQSQRPENKKYIHLNNENLLPDAGTYLTGFSAKPISVSQLDRYTNCPYQYFIERIISVPQAMEEDYLLSPIEKGVLLHGVLYKFFRILQKEQLENGTTKSIGSRINDDLPVAATVYLDESRLAHYQSLLKSILAEEIKKVSFEHPLFKLQEEKLAGNDFQFGQVNAYLNFELSRLKNEYYFRPVLFELSFGMKSKNIYEKAFEPVEIYPGLKLRGKIDRIELSFLDDITELLIADYKSSLSQNLSKSRIISGHSFQMPLYLLAAQRILKDWYNIDTVQGGASYYNLNPVQDYAKGKINGDKIVLMNSDSSLKLYNKGFRMNSPLDEVISSTISSAIEIISRISSGSFNLEPFKNACERCSYSNICRIKSRL